MSIETTAERNHPMGVEQNRIQHENTQNLAQKMIGLVNSRTAIGLAVSTLAITSATELGPNTDSASAAPSAATCEKKALKSPTGIKIINAPDSKNYRGLSFRVNDISECNSKGTRSLSYMLTGRIRPSRENFTQMGRKSTLKTNRSKRVSDHNLWSFDCRFASDKKFGAKVQPRVKVTWNPKKGKTISKVYPAENSSKGVKNICK